MSPGPLKFNHKCPVCDGPIHVVHGSFQCDIPIRESGWTIMVTPRNTNGTESFSCPKCKVTVPSMWVYKDDIDSMTKKQAEAQMRGWMPKEDKKKRGKKPAEEANK